jgi:hypothetical protein
MIRSWFLRNLNAALSFALDEANRWFTLITPPKVPLVPCRGRLRSEGVDGLWITCE